MLHICVVASLYTHMQCIVNVLECIVLMIFVNPMFLTTVGNILECKQELTHAQVGESCFLGSLYLLSLLGIIPSMDPFLSLPQDEVAEKEADTISDQGESSMLASTHLSDCLSVTVCSVLLVYRGMCGLKPAAWNHQHTHTIMCLLGSDCSTYLCRQWKREWRCTS